MDKTYISITITYYPSKCMKPEVHYYRNDGKTPYTSTFNKLTVEEANVMMWELVSMGGKNTFRSNPYNNAISERHVSFWGKL